VARSILQSNPKSQILEHGYINIYSELNSKEKRQINYKLLYKSKHPGWDETQVFLSGKFNELVIKDAIVLDAGCGNGNYVIDENRKNIAWAVGIDTDSEFFSKNICLDEVIVGNLENLPFDNNSFDAVVSLWVLEHLDNPKKVFSEIHRILKPGGIFLFATPYKYYFPLVFVEIINSLRLNSIVNKFLFGRDKKDIFKTFYKANTLKDVRSLSRDTFDELELKLNQDPSYTSFNGVTFILTDLLLNLFSRMNITLGKPHIIGILKKKYT